MQPAVCPAALERCGHGDRADDLVLTSAAKRYADWARIRDVENLDGYVRRILVNAFLAEQRSPWWKRVVLSQDVQVDEPWSLDESVRPIVASSASSETAQASADPITVGVSFGWLPTGLRADGWSFASAGEHTDHDIGGIMAETGGPNSPVLELSDASAGSRPTLPLSFHPAKLGVFTSGPSINGRPSFSRRIRASQPRSTRTFRTT